MAKRREWEIQNPPRQKFTKTDLAKFENAWAGLPHIVCLGAEKNFVRFAEQMEEESIVVDENYFRCTVAKAILWRMTEKLFDTLDLQGYRANSVAYAVAWIAEQSERRIDLDRIWREQRVSPLLSNALKAVCKAAHGHITSQEGNPGEASKRESCWNAFRRSSLSIHDGWKAELLGIASTAAGLEENNLSYNWERLRHSFIKDARTLADLESLTGRTWVATRRDDPVYIYAEKNWAELRGMYGMGARKIGSLIEILSSAGRL
jgi:hypothetical protein